MIDCKNNEAQTLTFTVIAKAAGFKQWSQQQGRHTECKNRCRVDSPTADSRALVAASSEAQSTLYRMSPHTVSSAVKKSCWTFSDNMKWLKNMTEHAMNAAERNPHVYS